MTECRASSGDGLSYAVGRDNLASIYLHGEGIARDKGFFPVRLVFNDVHGVDAQVFVSENGVGVVKMTPELLALITQGSWLSVEKGEEILGGYSLTGSADARRRFTQCIHRITGGAYKRRTF
jgi:hypothetical protein